MEVLDIIKKRRSIRFYTKEAISEDNVKKLVEAAVWAPSGHRLYARRIVIVQQERGIERIKAVSPGLHGIPPVLMILCRDKKREEEVADNYGPVGTTSGKFSKMDPEDSVKNHVEILSIMDVAISAQNICLEATALGIGSCMIGRFDQDAVRELLNLPVSIVPQLFVSLGYIDKSADVQFLRSLKKSPMRRSVKDTVVSWIAEGGEPQKK